MTYCLVSQPRHVFSLFSAPAATLCLWSVPRVPLVCLTALSCRCPGSPLPPSSAVSRNPVGRRFGSPCCAICATTVTTCPCTPQQMPTDCCQLQVRERQRGNGSWCTAPGSDREVSVSTPAVMGWGGLGTQPQPWRGFSV